MLDLLDGQVVHARQGRRDAYRPLESRLCAGSRPADVLAALADLFDFRVCYVADLDAILGRGDHRATLAALARAHPGLEFWLDAGPSPWAGDLGRRVWGSESLKPGQTVPRDGILSLDFRDGAFLGPPALLAAAEDWPDEVIVMSLEKVGSGSGPDLGRLAELQARGPGRRFYAAGGVRHGADLARLAAAGAAGVLLASALHDGRLGRDELEHELEHELERDLDRACAPSTHPGPAGP